MMRILKNNVFQVTTFTRDSIGIYHLEYLYFCIYEDSENAYVTGRSVVRNLDNGYFYRPKSNEEIIPLKKVKSGSKRRFLKRNEPNYIEYERRCGLYLRDVES